MSKKSYGKEERKIMDHNKMLVKLIKQFESQYRAGEHNDSKDTENKLVQYGIKVQSSGSHIFFIDRNTSEFLYSF